MTLVLAAAMKVSLVLAAACATAALLGRRSAALRHWVLAIGIVCGATTPALEAVLPAWPLPVPWIARDAAPTGPTGRPLSLRSSTVDLDLDAATIPNGPTAGTPVETFLLAFWVAGILVALSALIAGGVRLRRLTTTSTPIGSGDWHVALREVSSAQGVSRPIRLLLSAHPTFLMTWGLVRPTILLPESARHWSADRLRIVLHHEVAHIRRGDWAVQLAAALLKAIWWANPLAWLAERRLRQEAELACDDLVLRQGVPGVAYATHLLDVARAVRSSRRTWVPAPAVAHPSTLERRVRAMLNDHRNRTPLTPAVRVATTLAVAAATFVVAAGALSAAGNPAPVVAATGLAPDLVLKPTPEPAPKAAAPIKRAVRPAASPVQAPAASTAPGTFSGTLADTSGGALPGVEVLLTSSGRLSPRRTVSDGMGAFSLTDLPPGEYALRALLPGFETVQAAIAVAPDIARRVHIIMRLGSLEETILVTGQRPAARRPGPQPQPPPRPSPVRPQAVPQVLEARPAPERPPGVPVRVGGVVKQPVKLVHVSPIYPAALQASGVEGTVFLKSVVGPGGSVIDATPVPAMGTATPVDPDLLAASLDAVRQWTFSPTLLNNVAVPVIMFVSVQFSLQ